MIEDKKTDFPPEIVRSIRLYEQAASESIEKKDFAAAEREYRELLSKFICAQGTTARYHKGSPYHQIGYSLFLQGRNEEARTYFLYAFIEDSITLDYFPELPAFRNLSGAYGISFDALLSLFTRVRQDVKSDVPSAPEAYLAAYLDAGNKLDSVSVSKETKVFVGGNYRNIAILRHIEKTVGVLGLSPVVASNFLTKESEIYLHAMRLLQDCGSAIFEITFDAGHLMEIERATRFMDKGNILLLHQQFERDEKHYTRMLWGVEVAQIGYMDFDELTKSVKEFLEAVKQRNA